MKRDEFVLYGKIDSNGNLLVGYKGDLKEFLSENRSKNILITYQIQGDKASSQFKGLYWNKILPQVNIGMSDLGNRMDIKTLDYTLRHFSPYCKKSVYCEKENTLTTELLTIDDLNTNQLLNHVDFTRQFAAEHLNIIIE